MTDRDCLIAILKGLGAIHVAVTGKPLTIDIETEAGVSTLTEGQVPDDLGKSAGRDLFAARAE